MSNRNSARAAATSQSLAPSRGCGGNGDRFFPGLLAALYLIQAAMRNGQVSPPHWLPKKPTLQNYRIVFAPEAARRFAATQAGSLDYKVSGSAWTAFGTSAVVATAATLLSVVAGTLAAYSISRFRIGGDSFAFQFLSVRMFPPIAVVVPMVVLFSMLRLTDTHLGLILAYTAFTLPFSIWMIRSFIEEIPVDLEGVAQVHGMNQVEAFLKVTLPLIRAGSWRRRSSYSYSIGLNSCSL